MALRAALGAAISGFLIGMAAGSVAEEGELYRWTDSEGVVRYTPDLGQVPRDARDRLEVLGPEPSAAASDGAPEAPPNPGALPAVMGRKLPEQLVAPAKPPSPGEPDEIDARIAELREAIERDQAELRGLVAARGRELKSEAAADQDTRIRALANRLPELQEELARLERLRGGAGVGLEP